MPPGVLGPNDNSIATLLPSNYTYGNLRGANLSTFISRRAMVPEDKPHHNEAERTESNTGDVMVRQWENNKTNLG